MWSRLQVTKPLFRFVTSYESEGESHSVVSSSLRSYGLYSPWNSPGQNTGVGPLSLLQGIFHKSWVEPRSPTLQVDSWPAEPQGKPKNTGMVAYTFSSRSFWPRNRRGISWIAGGFFTNWTIREAQPHMALLNTKNRISTWKEFDKHWMVHLNL